MNLGEIIWVMDQIIILSSGCWFFQQYAFLLYFILQTFKVNRDRQAPKIQDRKNLIKLS